MASWFFDSMVVIFLQGNFKLDNIKVGFFTTENKKKSVLFKK
jgi:hypothetical protein